MDEVEELMSDEVEGVVTKAYSPYHVLFIFLEIGKNRNILMSKRTRNPSILHGIHVTCQVYNITKKIIAPCLLQ